MSLWKSFAGSVKGKVKINVIRDMGIAGLILKFNKKVKTNVERESIFIIKSHQTGPQFQKKKLSSVMTNCKD